MDNVNTCDYRIGKIEIWYIFLFGFSGLMGIDSTKYSICCMKDQRSYQYMQEWRKRRNCRWQIKAKERPPPNQKTQFLFYSLNLPIWNKHFTALRWDFDLANLKKQPEVLAKRYIMCHKQHIIHFNSKGSSSIVNHFFW